MNETIPPQFAHAVITASLHCQRCQYDLQGLEVEGRCPECGMANAENVVFAVDPDASRLPRLTDARGVGDAVFWLALCILLATLAVMLRPLLLGLGTFVDIWRFVPSQAGRYASLIAAGFALLGLISCSLLAPPRGREPSPAVWRDVALLATGLFLWALLGGLRWMSEGQLVSPLGGQVVTGGVIHIAMAGAGATALLGLRNVFVTIGVRSREYRSSRGGRQRVKDVLAALIGIAVGELLRMLAHVFRLDALQAIGTVVIWICSFMLVVGLVYLLVNAWWLQRSLRRPRPTYDQILLPPLPDDTTLVDIDEDEEFQVLGRDE